MMALAAAALLALPLDAVVVGVLADPLTLDPHRATDLAAAAVTASVCEPLVRLRPEGGRPAAALATSWATADGRTWTFTLRRGVRFHDGTPFDADAVAQNVERLRAVRAFPGRAERIGPHAVAIVLERPNAALLATLSQPFFAMQSPAAFAGGRAVGTGAFRLGDSRPGSIELLANPEHWAGPPRLARLLFRRFPDEDALVAALLAERIDVTAAIGQGRVGALRGARGVTLDSKTGLNLALLSVNNELPPFSDPRVRQALARAVDREALVDQILDGHGLPARNPLPPSLPGYRASARELRLDRPAARRLLREAGLASGFETSLLAVDSPRPYLPQPLRVAERLRQDLEQVGVRAKLTTVPSWADYLERATRGDYELAVLGWQADSLDANDFLAALLGSESIGSSNRSRYRSPQMDSLLKRGRLLSGPEERAAVYADAQELFQREMPFVPLYHVAVFAAYRQTLNGLSIGATGLLGFERAWKAER